MNLPHSAPAHRPAPKPRTRGDEPLTEEGNIVPVVYGLVWVGSVVISAGMYPEEVI